MGQRRKIETRRLAVEAHHFISGLVRPVWHFCGRQIGQTGEQLVDLCAQPRRFGAGPRLDFLVLGGLTQ